MRFDIMTLFPELVERVLGESIIGRAQEAGYTVVKAHNIRDYSEDKHRRVDDTPYGGGKGMLMAAPPIYNCYRGVLADQLKDGFDGRRHVIYLSPGGRVLTQAIAEELDMAVAYATFSFYDVNSNHPEIELYDTDGSVGAAKGAGIGAGIYKDNMWLSYGSPRTSTPTGRK